MQSSKFKGRVTQRPSQFEWVQQPRVNCKPKTILVNSRNKSVGLKTQQTFRTPINLMTIYFSIKAYVSGRWNRCGFLTFRQLLLVTFLWQKGFINYVVWTKSEPIEPQLFYYHINSPFFPLLSDARLPELKSLSRGFSLDQDMAFHQTVGECLERVPFLYYRNDSLLTGAWQEVSKLEKAIDPSEFDTFSPEQRRALGLVLRQPDSIYRWQRVERLQNAGGKCVSQSVIIPAQAVWFKYKYADNEPRLAEFSTHGYAAHYTKEEATLSALYEWIERDGFFSYWLWGVIPPRVDYRDLQSKRILELVKAVEACDYQVTILDVTLPDIKIPAIFCVLTNPAGKVYAVGGAGCNIDIEVAIYKSLCEASSMLHWSLIHCTHNSPQPVQQYPYSKKPYGDIERFTFWAQSENHHILKSWLQGEYVKAESYKTISQKHTTESVVGHLNTCGHNVYRYAAQHPVLDTLNFHAVRVSVPSLVPIFLDMRYAPLAHSRLQVVKQLLKAQNRKSLTNYQHYFNYPHLFP